MNHVYARLLIVLAPMAAWPAVSGYEHPAVASEDGRSRAIRWQTEQVWILEIKRSSEAPWELHFVYRWQEDAFKALWFIVEHAVYHDARVYQATRLVPPIRSAERDFGKLRGRAPIDPDRFYLMQAARYDPKRLTVRNRAPQKRSRPGRIDLDKLDSDAAEPYRVRLSRNKLDPDKLKPGLQAPRSAKVRSVDPKAFKRRGRLIVLKR